MTEFFISLSIWTHAVATAIFIGHYLLMAGVYIPALRNQPNGGMALSAMSRGSRLWLYASLLIFMLTGVYLMLVDPDYQGIGQFNNLWSMMMLVKHLLIVAMIGMGFWFNMFQRGGPAMAKGGSDPAAIARFDLHCKLMALCGVIVLLLTAIAQAG